MPTHRDPIVDNARFFVKMAARKGYHTLAAVMDTAADSIEADTNSEQDAFHRTETAKLLRYISSQFANNGATHGATS